MLRAICFGAAGSAKRLYVEINKKYEVIAFVDNDAKKVNIDKSLFGVPIYEPTYCLNTEEYDYIIITSAPGLESIKQQLIDMGLDEGKIITSYIEAPIESRRVFLEKIAECIDFEDGAACAEAGVFEGDFARYINCYFPNRILHLFDTFEGFDERDIEKEREYSKAQVGDYGNTSVEMVMKKMPFPKQIIVHKGYFPETAEGIQSKFCFVNLDLDLYEPTYNGLNFFKNRMVKNGVILVHDYFADNFRGPKEAVDRFICECEGKIHKYPIGDGISIMLVGFE